MCSQLATVGIKLTFQLASQLATVVVQLMFQLAKLQLILYFQCTRLLSSFHTEPMWAALYHAVKTCKPVKQNQETQQLANTANKVFSQSHNQHTTDAHVTSIIYAYNYSVMSRVLLMEWIHRPSIYHTQLQLDYTRCLYARVSKIATEKYTCSHIRITSTIATIFLFN